MKPATLFSSLALFVLNLTHWKTSFVTFKMLREMCSRSHIFREYNICSGYNLAWLHEADVYGYHTGDTDTTLPALYTLSSFPPNINNFFSSVFTGGSAILLCQSLYVAPFIM